MSDSVQPHRWQPTRLPHPWDSPGNNTGVGCHFLLQCMKGKLLSQVWLFATPWTVAYQAPLSMGFSRQEYWSGVPSPSPTDLDRSFQKERLRGLYRDVLETVSVVKTGNCSENSDVFYLPPTHTHWLQPGNFNIWLFFILWIYEMLFMYKVTLQIMYFKIIIWIIISI